MLVVTWAPGGNLPPLLAAAALLSARGHDVYVLASSSTAPAAAHEGFPTLSYRRSPDPDTGVSFERQAAHLMATAAGVQLGHDVRDALAETRADLAVIDCMLPAGLAAARGRGTPAASLVHFRYGPARHEMLRHGGGWTTDLEALTATCRALGVPAPDGGISAWESADLLLVTAPRWFDLDVDYPEHVIHAGPLGVRTRTPEAGRPPGQPPHVLVAFSTTVMEGQLEAVQLVCDGLATTGLRATLSLGGAVDGAALRVPDEVNVLPWADHERLLRTCTTVVTHAGLGTTLRALAHGRPLLLLPLGRDQHLNAARVVELGAGIRLAADASPSGVRAALTRLLVEPCFAAAASAVAARIADDEPDQRAGDALAAILGGKP